MKDSFVAEDIAAEAIAKAFRKNTDFATLEKLKGFLFITINNAALDYLKVEKRHYEAHEKISYMTRGEMDDVELAYIKAEAIRSVYAAIELLPQQPRKVITMAFVEGKKLPEIAKELNLSYNTVQNYRGRGLELIRTHLIKNSLLSGPALWFALGLLDIH